MKQWGFYFDQTRCVNCKACVMACKAWNGELRGDAKINPDLNWISKEIYEEPSEYENLPGSSGEQNYEEYGKYHMKENWRRIIVTEHGDVPPNVDVLNFSVSCNHCNDPVCVRVCPTNYIYKESEYGIVLTDDTKKCISCRLCKKSCPWSSPQFYDDGLYSYKISSLEKPKMTKCNLCIDRIKEGLKPACVAGCIMRALDAGPIEELREKYSGYSKISRTFKGNTFQGLNKGTEPNIIIKKKISKVLKKYD